VPQRRNVTLLVRLGKKRDHIVKMETEGFLTHLGQHIPSGASALIAPLIEGFNFSLMVTNERKTKHGDYRFPMRSSDPHKISVNGTLNKYAFLLTFLHEIAHMHAFEKYGKRIKPHGMQWKRTFTKIARPFLKSRMWPEDITEVLQNYFVNPKASSAGDLALTRVLRSYDEIQDLYLEDLDLGAAFYIGGPSGRLFEKGIKRRTRYLCKELGTRREFTIHGMAKVFIED